LNLSSSLWSTLEDEYIAKKAESLSEKDSSSSSSEVGKSDSSSSEPGKSDSSSSETGKSDSSSSETGKSDSSSSETGKSDSSSSETGKSDSSSSEASKSSSSSSEASKSSSSSSEASKSSSSPSEASKSSSSSSETGKSDSSSSKISNSGSSSSKGQVQSGHTLGAVSDTITVITTAQNITKQEIDLAEILNTSIDTSGVITTVKGAKFTTTLSTKVASAVSSDKKAVDVKVNKKKGIATVKAKKGIATIMFMLEDGTVVKVTYIVEVPKAVRTYKKMSVGGEPVTLSVYKDLFGTNVSGGTIVDFVSKTGTTTVDKDAKTITINPTQKDVIKVTYQFLNKKYKYAIKIK